MGDKLGLCQWFHYEAYDDVIRTIEVLHDLGVRHLRTGISWADFLRPQGKRWYDWQMKTLHEAGFQLLLSVWHVPPSLSEGASCASPPRRLRDYADFIDQIITLYDDQFAELELWNEPNNRFKWNFDKYDPRWAKFGEMVGTAAYWAQRRDRKTVLGGMIPVDHTWLELMYKYGVMPHIDVVAIHGFPEMWWNDVPNWEWYQHWRGWSGQVAYIAPYADGRPIWITETGFATWDMEQQQPGRHQLQVTLLEKAAAAPVVFTSTNKVYGNLADLQLTENKTRYTPSGWDDNESGISEQRRLDFYSPYGCSKGTADQYVLDYVRIFGLRATVFRMSCIYAAHQFGTEDQGWVAHFLLRAIQNQPITIYGNGKQVRDILFVDDLVCALQLAQTQIEGLAGEAFNIGGGVNNPVSLLEILQLIKQVHGQPLTVNFSDWRPGDQRYYVSDTTKFYAATNWRPQLTVNEGLRRLYQWLCQTYRASSAFCSQAGRYWWRATGMK